ncbi:uncharacterized protein LOC124909805 [Impatiens glandulifera]|uniref:uncharacterized protein LOC124909805 n=1 Tax=Impatiens glandulifera TaxID=253017 RepID=UPI001FB19BA2|nr:uncharacterized protein LOC124909805 [Impatiens glandulifera]
MELFGFVGILRETFRILLSKNGKLIAVITFISMFFSLLFSIGHILFTVRLKEDIIEKGVLIMLSGPMDPESADLITFIGKDIGILLLVSWAFFISNIILSVFTMVSTTFVSARFYQEKEKTSFSFKELLLKVNGSIFRPTLTLFYILLMCIGLFSLAFSLLVLLSLFIDLFTTLKAIAIATSIIVLTIWLYLSVVFRLAMVISVLDERFSGIQALGKAGGLVKKKRLDGFVLNLLFAAALIAVDVPYIRMRIDIQSASVVIQVIIGAIVVVFSEFVAVFEHMSYTALYFECKRIHGEEIIELQGNLEYKKLPSMAITAEDLP